MSNLPLLGTIVVGSIRCALVAMACFGFGRLGVMLALPPGITTVVWFPSGIAIAAVLIWGRGVWPGILAGSFLAYFPMLLDVSEPSSISVTVLTTAAIAAGSTLQALFGGSLIRRFLPSMRCFTRVLDVVAFLAISFVVCLVAATIGVAGLLAAGLVVAERAAETWMTWWIGDAIGILVLTPAILAWSDPKRTLKWEASRSVEIAALAVVLTIASVLTFVASYGPSAFIMFPLLIWTGFRFGQRGLTAFVLATVVMGLWSMIDGYGPFAREHLQESLVLLQSFIAVLAISGLAMTAALHERDELSEKIVVLKAEEERRRNDVILSQTQRLVSIGQTMAGIADEIKNPAAFVHANLSVLKESVRDLRDALSSEIDDGAKAIAALDNTERLAAESVDGMERILDLLDNPRGFVRAGWGIDPPLQSRRRVVCVDDEPEALSSMQRLLRNEPYDLMTTSDPWQALEWVKRHEIGVFMTDHRMPEVRGVTLGVAVRNISPRTRILVVTGYPNDIPLVECLRPREIHRVIRKPWDNDDLRKIIIDEMDIHEMSGLDRAERR